MLAALGVAAYYAGWIGSRQALPRAVAVEEGERGPALGHTSTASEHTKDPYIGRQAAWAEAKATRKAWKRFIEAYPDGKLAAKAGQAIAAIDRKARGTAARKAWMAAGQAGTRVALQRFLTAYPKSEHATEAKEALAHPALTRDGAPAAAAP